MQTINQSKNQNQRGNLRLRFMRSFASNLAGSLVSKQKNYYEKK